MERIGYSSFKLLNCLLLFFLYFLMDFVYIKDVATIYNYEGFFKYDIPENLFTARVSFILFMLFFTFFKCTDFIYNVVNAFIILLLLPNLILHQYMYTSSGVIFSCYVFIISILLISLIEFRFKSRQVRTIIQARLILAISIILIFPFFLSFGFNFNFNIFLLGAEVYDVRLEARSKFNTLTAYTFNWLVNIVLPIGMIFASIYKNKIVFIIYILLFLYLFLCNASKAILFFVIIIIFLYFGNYKRKVINYTLFTISIFLVACYNDDNVLITGTFINRPFFGPALLCHYYFDFFDAKQLYLSSSILRRFIHYPFDAYPANLIGDVYFNSPKMNANSGIPSDGFMNFGYVGVVIFSLIEAFLISYLNALRIHHKFFGVVFITMTVLISSELFTSLLTHGLIVFLLIANYMLKDTALTIK